MPQLRDDPLFADRSRAWFSDPLRTHPACPHCSAEIHAIVHSYFNTGYDRGYRNALVRSSQLSPHIMRFVELLTWLLLGNEDDLRSRYSRLYAAALGVLLCDPSNQNERMHTLALSVADITSEYEQVDSIVPKEPQTTTTESSPFADITPQIEYWKERGSK